MNQPLHNVNLYHRYLLRRNYYPSIGIDFKFKLRDVLNTKIEEICTWLDLDDNYTKAFTKPSKNINLHTQKSSYVPSISITKSLDPAQESK